MNDLNMAKEKTGKQTSKETIKTKKRKQLNYLQY
jgi:hypothetical protein